MKKKKKQKKEKLESFSRKEIAMLKEASLRIPSKHKKQTLFTFKCNECNKVHYFKVKKCVLCECEKIEIIKNPT
jgi:hypothetical protein